MRKRERETIQEGRKERKLGGRGVVRGSVYIGANKTVKQWSMLPREVMSPSLEIFKIHLDYSFSNLV